MPLSSGGPGQYPANFPFLENLPSGGLLRGLWAALFYACKTKGLDLLLLDCP